MSARRFWLWAAVMLVALLVIARCSDAAQPRQLFTWSHRYDVPKNIVVTIDYVSAVRLHNLQIRYGNTEHAQAISILHARGDGQWSCEIFIGPTDDRPYVLEHELKHCHGWVHQ